MHCKTTCFQEFNTIIPIMQLWKTINIHVCARVSHCIAFVRGDEFHSQLVLPFNKMSDKHYVYLMLTANCGLMILPQAADIKTDII